MKVIILAAGEGRRLMPYTDGIPKCMVEVNGTPLINYQIDVIRRSGINDIVIVKGHYSEKINIKGTRTYINKIYNKTNMVSSLFCAESELEGEVIISYGDIAYSDSNLQKLIKCKDNISVVIDLDWKKYWMERFQNPLDDAETLRLDKLGRIIEIGKPAKDYSQINGQYIGLIKFTSIGIKRLKQVFNKSKESNKLQNRDIDSAYMTDLLQTLIDEGENIWPVTVQGEWVEIDTVKDLGLDITRNRLELIHQ
jgi:L-glutamine-phosphate cytidylyltransferase